jgi:hypothetical protein
MITKKNRVKNTKKKKKKNKNWNPGIMQYAGAINLLCECTVFVDEDLRSSIESAVSDWCETTGWTWRKILDRIELIPPEAKLIMK